MAVQFRVTSLFALLPLQLYPFLGALLGLFFGELAVEVRVEAGGSLHRKLSGRER